MKLIKKENAVLLKGYEITELEKEIQDGIILNFRIKVLDFATAQKASRKELLEFIKANDYLFSKTGNLIPLTYHDSGKIYLTIVKPFIDDNRSTRIEVSLHGVD